MSVELQQVAFVGFFFVLPGAVGAWLAWTKGRNVILWWLLNTLFPPTLMVTIFQGPARQVQGHYRQCPSCREFTKWREKSCKYCKTQFAD